MFLREGEVGEWSIQSKMRKRCTSKMYKKIPMGEPGKEFLYWIHKYKAVSNSIDLTFPKRKGRSIHAHPQQESITSQARAQNFHLTAVTHFAVFPMHSKIHSKNLQTTL